MVHDWIQVSSRIRFTKSVIVKISEGSILFVTVEVGVLEIDKE